MNTHQGDTGHNARGNKTQKLPEIDNFSCGNGWFCGRKRIGIGKKEKNREERNEEKKNTRRGKMEHRWRGEHPFTPHAFPYTLLIVV